MLLKSLKKPNIVWHYITGLANEDLEFLKTNFKFHPLDLKDCAGEVQRSKIDIYNNYLFIVLQLPSFDQVRKVVTVDQCYIFVAKNYIITITKNKLKSLNNIFYKIANSPKSQENISSQGTGYILYKILDYVLSGRWEIIGYLEDKVQAVESHIESGQDEKLVFQIALLRRLILQFKSILDPQRLTINTLSRLKVSFLDQETLVYFDDLDDFIEKIFFSLESYRDRIITLQEINESLLSYRTNKIMKILTVFSVALLPLTFLTGFYGMNIDLPFASHPFSIWFLFGLLATLILLTFFILKKKDWI